MILNFDKYIKIGWTLYFEDQYGNYIDNEGYNPSGYRWNGTAWVNREGYTPIRYKSLEGEETIFVILDNPLFFCWELKSDPVFPYDYKFISSFQKLN